MNAASVVSSKLLAGGRAATQLAIIPAVLVPVWLLGISAFSTIGLLPAGATALALVSWVFLRNYASISKNTELSREIASKLASNFLIVSAVSLLFLVFQIIVWLFATQFSPTLGTIIFMINHLPAETIIHVSESGTLITRITLIAALIIVSLLAPLLSIRAVRISRSVSKTLDRITWCVITALLFVFFGDSPAGVNAATVVLRKEQNEIDALYRQARDDAAAKIVARSIYVAIKADETLSRGARPIAVPQIGPARPPGSPAAATETGPRPASGGGTGAGHANADAEEKPIELNAWDKQLFDRIVDADDKSTSRTARDITIPSHNRAQPESIPPKASTEKLTTFSRDITRVVEPSDLPKAIAPLRELSSIALDAIELPNVITPAVTRLANTTVSGRAAEQMVSLISDAIFQDALRSAASELVGDFLEGAIQSAGLNNAINRYAEKFLSSGAGQRLTSTLEWFKGYGAEISKRVVAFRAGGSDEIVELAAKSNIEQFQRMISELATFREEAPTSLRESSAETERELVAKAGALARENSTFAEQVGRIKQRVATASSSSDKLAAQQALLALVQAQGRVSANVVLCRCVNRRTGAVVYSFFAPQTLCISGSRC